MKNKTAKTQKIIVGALASVGVASLVGSISGTIAWYQYSTRASAAYTGASAKCTENLEVRLFRAESGLGDNRIPEFDSGWKSNLRIADVQDYLSSYDRTNGDYDLRPVTTGALELGQAKSEFYAQPLPGKGPYENWIKAKKSVDYIELPLQFRVQDQDGDPATKRFLEQNLYLADLTLRATDSNTQADITDALRVSFDIEGTDDDFTFSKNGQAVDTYGHLDVDGDGILDEAVAGSEYSYEFDGNLEAVKYGDFDAKGQAKSYGLDRADFGGNWMIDGEDYAENVHIVDIVEESEDLFVVNYDDSTSFKFRQELDKSGENLAMKYSVVYFEEGAVEPGAVEIKAALKTAEINANDYEDGDKVLDIEAKKLYTVSVENDVHSLDAGVAVALNDAFKLGQRGIKCINLTDHTIGRKGEDAAEARYIADDRDPENIIGSPIAQTPALVEDDNTLDSDWLDVTVRIYLEGWTELANDNVIAVKDYVDAAGLAALDPEAVGEDDLYVNSEDGKVYHVEGEAGSKAMVGVAAEADKLYKANGLYYSYDPVVADDNGTPDDASDDIYDHYFVEVSGPAIWDAEDFVGSAFNVGMTFAVPAL